MSDPIYLFAGGGTGGHLYPALAVAEELKKIQPGARFVFACSDREIDKKILARTDHAIIPQPIRPLPRSFVGWPRFLDSYIRSSKQAKALIDDLKPAAVLAAGGFAAVPVAVKAAKASIPVAILNPDAATGLANRNLARYADAIFTQFESTAGHFSARFTSKISCVGCPIRKAISEATRDDGIDFFGLQGALKTLLVVGGSGGAQAINEAIGALDNLLDDFAQTWQVLHVTGPAKSFSQRYGPLHTVRLEYCDRMDLAYAAADLAVTRAGAVTAAELTASRTPAIVLPYPHAGGHQMLNAEELSSCGAASVVEDSGNVQENTSRLSEVLRSLLGDNGQLEVMSSNSKALAKPQAASDVAKWLASRGD